MEAAKLHQCHKTSTPGAPVRTCHGQPESVPAPSPGQRAGIQAAGVVGQDVKQGALGALVGQDDAPPQAAQGTCSEIRREWGGGGAALTAEGMSMSGKGRMQAGRVHKKAGLLCAHTPFATAAASPHQQRLNAARGH